MFTMRRHCPHEEDVDAFVSAISAWMDAANAGTSPAVAERVAEAVESRNI